MLPLHAVASVLLLLSLAACNTTPEKPSPTEEALQRIDSVSARLNEINATATHILQRRTVVLYAPVQLLFKLEAMQPSAFLREVQRGSAKTHGKPFLQLLEDTLNGRTIRYNYFSECLRLLRESDGFTVLDELPSKPIKISEDHTRVAKGLDAVVTVVFESCPKPGQKLNTPTRSWDWDTFSNKIPGAAQTREKALNALIEVAESDTDAMLLGQAFHFDSADDKSVPPTNYLKRQVDKGVARIRSLYLPIAKNANLLKVVFDREVTASGKELSKNPRGWFNAVAEKDAIYLSPTITRAAFVSCAKEMRQSPGLANRLETETKPKLKSRHQRPSDTTGIVRLAEGIADKVDSCIAEQLDFLLAHELAHAVLKIAEEERADCVARSVVRLLGHNSLGVFGRTIFPLARGGDYGVLGASKTEAASIVCRDKRQLDFAKLTKTTLPDIVKICEAQNLECESKQ